MSDIYNKENNDVVVCVVCGSFTPIADAAYCGETQKYVCGECGEFDETYVFDMGSDKMLHCSECKYYHDNYCGSYLEGEFNWDIYYKNLKCDLGERIFIDIACDNFVKKEA